MALKGNKGEWSEFYAFLKTLTEQKLYSADSDLNLIKGEFFVVRGLERNDVKNGWISYEINKNQRDVSLKLNNGSVSTVNLAKLKASVKPILEEIHKGKNAFEVPSARALMDLLKWSSIKQKPADKADFVVTANFGMHSVGRAPTITSRSLVAIWNMA